MINGIIEDKLSRIEPYLTKIDAVVPKSFEAYEADWKVQMIAERALQILIEIMIDVANRLIALKGWGAVSSASDAVRLIALKGAISAEEPYLKMVRFRNFIVHDYDRIDHSIVYTILTRHLDDIRRFRDEIARYE